MSTYASVTHVRDTVFRNMRLEAALVDVSYGGIVRLDRVALANVTLPHAAVVSTGANDYDSIPLMDGVELSEPLSSVYLPDDDAAYDVPVGVVPPGERGPFALEFLVKDATMSDCLFQLATDPVYPGCPAASAEARRIKAVVSARVGGEPTSQLVNGRALLDQFLLQPDDVWLVATQQVCFHHCHWQLAAPDLKLEQVQIRWGSFGGTD